LSLSAARIDELARQLEEAELSRTAIDKITDLEPGLDWKEAYDIQWAVRRRKLARGTRIAGLKMGLTSRAKMQQMGVLEPIYGYLADYFVVPSESALPRAELIHPRVEAEIAFHTSRALSGPGCTVATALAATDFVVAALEVIDSRYRNFKFDLKSVIADNASSARFVSGVTAGSPRELDLPNLGVVLYKNGVPEAFGAGAAVLGHPAESLATLANLLAERGESIPAGTFVMTGGITEAIAVDAGDHIAASVQGLGSVSIRFT
jgi:2-oxo-3-hexenedioate decarboxylase